MMSRSLTVSVPAAHRARLGDLVARRVVAQHLDDGLHRGQGLREQRPLLLRLFGERLQDSLLGLRAEPGERSQPLGLGSSSKLVQRRDPELLPDPSRRLRAEGREPEELGDAARDPLLALGQRLDLARSRRSGRSWTRSSCRFPGASWPRLRGRARRSGLQPYGSGRRLGGRRAPGTAPRPRARAGRQAGRTGRPPARSGAASSPRHDHMDVLVVCLPTYNERENLEAMVSALVRRAARATAGFSSSTTTLPTAPARSPTGWRPS